MKEEQMIRKLVGVAALASVAALAVGAGPSGATGATGATGAPPGCPITLPQDGDQVTLDPATFTNVINNPWWPMAVGSKWVARETDNKGDVQKNVVIVKARTKDVIGITAAVVHDTVSEHGAVVEDTFDWYAQDSCGNIWYLGENTKELENGHVTSTAGSWEAGVDGAQPGVIVPADPQVGATYRQEYLAGEAEDAATTLSLDEQIQVPYGHFEGTMLTKEFTAVEPNVNEYKFYVQGVGPALALTISGGSDREELVSFEPGSP